jgi:tetratricopeptide (TPR) repeat protein
MVVLLLIAVVGVWLVASLVGPTTPRPAPAAEFVVRVAPFVVEGGDERAGQLLAQQVRDELATHMRVPVNLGVIHDAVAGPDDAAAIASASNIDLLVWGYALPGGTPATPTLRPHLTWTPGTPFEPRRWQGYDAHLALPRHWDLALVPLNASAVLPPLLDAITLFGRGEADRAFEQLGDLGRRYEGVLRPELPATLRSVILWAEGLFADAEAETRRALDSVPSAQQWNNLGALLLDQRQNDAARAALTRAIELEPNLVAAHANLGRLFMNEDRPADALPNLATAAQTDPRPATLATLAEASRRAGLLEQARVAIAEVLARDADNGPALSERAMLGLTDVATTTGRLEWELERAPSRSADELTAIRDEGARGVANIETLHAEYLRRANAYGVDGRPQMQRLMETQARRLEEELLNRRYQLVLAMIEQGRLTQGAPRTGFWRLWDAIRGNRTPLEQAIDMNVSVLRQAPGGTLQYELQYQRGRAAYLAGDGQYAAQAWQEAIALTTTGTPTATLLPRPEALYGRALLMIDEGRRADAQAELRTALAADERFFPAQETLANLALEDGRWADAEPHLRWLVERRPSAEATVNLVTALREQGRFAEAEALLLPLANRDDAPSLVLLARMYRESGQLDAADGALRRALSVAPQRADVYMEQALVLLARPNPDYDEADRLLRQAIKADPTRPEPHVERGKLLATALGRPGEAADEWRAAVALNANDPLAFRRLGETLLENGAPESAVDAFNRALRIQPNSHEAHHGLATAYLALGRLDDAERATRRALELAQGNYTLALVGLGDILRERALYDDAIAQYNAALERDATLTHAYLGLGRTAMRRGNADIAIGHYRRALETSPNSVPLLLALGDALLASNDLVGATETYTRVKELSPGNAAAFAGMGQALWKGGRTQEALDELAQAVERNPADAATLLTIGDINDALNQPDQALAAYEQAIAVREDWYEPHFRRGVLLLGRQNTAAAIDEFRATVRLNDEFPQGHYWLGRAYRAAGDYGDAVRELRRAIELQPDYYEARYFLGRSLDEQGDGANARATYQAIRDEAPPADPWRVEAERELSRIGS